MARKNEESKAKDADKKAESKADAKCALEDNATPISQAAYARRIGCSPQFISKLVKQKVVTLTEDGKVIPKLADQQREAWADPSREHRRKENSPDNGKAGSVNEGEPDIFSDEKLLDEIKDLFTPEDINVLRKVLEKVPSWNGARRVSEFVKAQNELLEYQEKRGQLVEVVEVEQFWAEKLAMVKTKLLALPRSMADKLAALALDYASELGRALAKAIGDIKKKKSGSWKYDAKAGVMQLYSGKSKKPFTALVLNPEAPEFADSMVTNKTEKALSEQVHSALNELVEKDANSTD